MALKKLTIVGAGWAGLSAAVAATQAGWQVSLFEAAPVAGGRARGIPHTFAGKPLDNGQHILIGAYRESLSLMRTVGLAPDQLLQRVPLDMRFSDGQGLVLPDLPVPFNLWLGLARAEGWGWRDKASLMQTAWRWQRAKFDCDATWTVSTLCAHTQLSPRVMGDLVEPLCLSALNISPQQAQARVFLRVLKDALLGGAGSSDLLIPKVDLSQLLPEATCGWLKQQGAQIHLGQRWEACDVDQFQAQASAHQPLLLACPAWEAARLVASLAPTWANQASALTHTAIATVYLQSQEAADKGLPRPMLALRSDALAPAQFVFDRGALTGQHGLLAAVVSACELDRETLTERVHTQVRAQLGLQDLAWRQTVVEKRATFACTPDIRRPAPWIADHVWACGDYILGPYPATLEGAVRSGQQVVAQLCQVAHGEGVR